MKYILVLSLAIAVVAPAPGALLPMWVQIGAGAPGTTDAARVDVVQPDTTTPTPDVPSPAPGVPTPDAQPAAAQPAATGGLVVLPGGGPQPTGPSAGGSVQSPLPGPVGQILSGNSSSAPSAAPAPGAVSTGTSLPGAGSKHMIDSMAPGAPAAPCDRMPVVLSNSVSAQGGLIEVVLKPQRGDCPPPNFGASGSWLHAEGTPSPELLRFLARPNESAQPRAATIIVDNRVFRIEQPGLPPAPIAASPARLMFGIFPRRETKRRTISLWSDDPAVHLSVEATVPWIRIGEIKKTKRGTKRVDVTIEIDLAPVNPRSEGAILVRGAAGAAPLKIPVVAERGRLL